MVPDKARCTFENDKEMKHCCASVHETHLFDEYIQTMHISGRWIMDLMAQYDIIIATGDFNFYKISQVIIIPTDLSNSYQYKLFVL